MGPAIEIDRQFRLANGKLIIRLLVGKLLLRKTLVVCKKDSPNKSRIDLHDVC
jgi:hypothetical protein